MNRSNVIIFIILLLLVGLSAWLGKSFKTGDDDQTATSDPDGIDYYMENFTISSMNLQGQPRQDLSAIRMEHYSSDDSTALTEPRIVVYKEDTAPWYINANRGWISADGEIVLLKGNVTIERPAENHKGTMKISTSELRIRPDDEYAETDKAIVMEGDGTRTEAVGMRAYMKQGKLHLLNRVRGHYE
jgi:lipopolysaccharide export system protein LptC